VQSTFQLAPGSGRVALNSHSRESNGGGEHLPVGPREWKSGARLSLPGVKWRCRALASWPPGVEEWRSTFTPGSQMAVQSTFQLAPGSGKVALDSHSRESKGGAEHFPVGPREWKSGARLSLPGVKWRCRALSSWLPGVEVWRWTFTPGSQMAVQSTFQLAPGSGSVALDFHSREWKRGAGIHSRESDGSAGSFAVDFREPGSQLRLSLIRCNQY